jgi:HD-GYP domain-containing protein (c-di-GMP phosphodiesterase class II)
MTQPTRAARATMAMTVPTEAALESMVRLKGRALILALYTAMRAIKLYPVGHATVQRALEDLAGLTRQIVTDEHELEVRVSGEFIFVNGIRLRLDLENYASFSQVLSTFRVNGIGVLHVAQTVEPRDWQVFVGIAHSASDVSPDERLETFVEKLHAANVHAFELEPPSESEGGANREESKERAKRTYSQSVAVTKELMASVRVGRTPNIKKMKRVVQGIVDQILNEETSILGLTAIRDYDEYTFTHSVNVCIFSVALGKRLGLTKVQLYDLGMAALFHDIGKSRVPLEVLNKVAALTDEEWRQIAAHPWLGVLALFQIRGTQEYPYRSMVVAVEHHMKTDLTGYPRPIRPREMSMYSKIVACADGFDAATSRRAYQTTPLNPAEVLREMRDNPRRGLDPVVVKAFINLTGMYPVGTLVVLDTLELGVVHAVNPMPDMLSRPLVRIIGDSMGNLLHPGAVVDLAERKEDGSFARSIIKTENPERFGIRVGDYFI